MDSLEAARRIPGSTYRLQLDRTFTFADAREVVPYLDALGITDCYLSPLLAPSSAHSHGYDVSDHGRLSPALGTETDYAAFAEALRARGMGQILDVVPNHMGIAGSRNAWWMDALENGPASPYAAYFDIDWDPLKPELKNKVLLPILGDQYGRVLENQDLVLEFREGAFFVRYHDTLLPVAPRSYAQVLRVGLDEPLAALGPDDPPAADRDRPGPARGAQPRVPGHQAAPRGPLRGVPHGGRPRRGRRPPVQRRQGRPDELRPARRAARRAGLPPRLLAGRGRRDQLPALLRRQRPRRDPDGGARGLRRGPPADLPARPRGVGHGAPRGPPGWPLRARAVPRRAPAALLDRAHARPRPGRRRGRAR